MKINTKEKYLKIHKPIKPKNREKKKEKTKIKKTVKSLQKIPIIPDKDKQSTTFNTSLFKKPFHIGSINITKTFNWIHTGFGWVEYSLMNTPSRFKRKKKTPCQLKRKHKTKLSKISKRKNRR